MERRAAAFLLLGILYLAGTLVTVQAVTYSGASVVQKGQPWTIECTGLKPNDPIRWTKNGESLERELASGDLMVESKVGTGISKLSTKMATEGHDGDYKCTPESSDVFHLSIHYDVKIKVLASTDTPMVLECGNRTAGEKLEWLKGKESVLTALTGHEDMFKIDNETGTLELLKEAEPLYGDYTCRGTNSSTEYRIVPKPTAHLADSTSVVEGEKLHLVCGGKQSPGIKVLWTFGEQNYTRSKGRVKIDRDQDKGIYGAVLIVENIEMNDRGTVSCRVSYNWSDTDEEHMAEAHTFLRVKDKYAALWPFLGICAEVVVLCAIILVYENKRNKAELEESDTDQSPDTKPTPNKDSDVRQRK